MYRKNGNVRIAGISFRRGILKNRATAIAVAL
jgi:hypothetical protein